MTEKEYETESWVKEILEKASKKAKYQIAREVLLQARDKADAIQNHLDASCIDVALKHVDRLDQQEEE